MTMSRFKHTRAHVVFRHGSLSGIAASLGRATNLMGHASVLDECRRDALQKVSAGWQVRHIAPKVQRLMVGRLLAVSKSTHIEMLAQGAVVGPCVS